MTDPWDAVVVGAGIVGSWTAFHLQKLGQRTLLIEQFPLPTTRGSSHGATRTFRLTGQADMPLMLDAYEQWHRLSADVGEQLIVKTGRLTFSDGSKGPFLDGWSHKMKQMNIPHELLTDEQIHRRWPDIKYDGHRAIYEPNGSVLQAHKCVNAVQTQFNNIGGQLWDATKVLKINVKNDKQVDVIVQKANGVQSKEQGVQMLHARCVVVTAGAWAGKLLPELTGLLRPLATAHTYWRVLTPGAYSVRNGFPVISQTRERRTYGIPAFEYIDCIKIASMDGKGCDPDERDTRDLSDSNVAQSREYIQEHYPHVDASRPVIVEKCLFTFTPDEQFIIDRHPNHPNLIIGAGFSAEGFMGSPATGKLLAHLAVKHEQKLNYETHLYKLDRFKIATSKL